MSFFKCFSILVNLYFRVFAARVSFSAQPHKTANSLQLYFNWHTKRVFIIIIFISRQWNWTWHIFISTHFWKSMLQRIFFLYYSYRYLIYSDRNDQFWEKSAASFHKHLVCLINLSLTPVTFMPVFNSNQLLHLRSNEQYTYLPQDLRLRKEPYHD